MVPGAMRGRSMLKFYEWSIRFDSNLYFYCFCTDSVDEEFGGRIYVRASINYVKYVVSI